MKMLLPRFLSTVICTVFIATGAVSAVDVKKEFGDQVSFRPDKFIPPVTSIIWKHKNSSGITVKAIEWEKGESEILIPNPRFKGITTVDEKTGEITITNLNYNHSGVYTIDINSKEQEQRFTLTVIEPMATPKITKERTKDPHVVYLRCEYSEKIIWKNSAGETLTGSPIGSKGESITVKKNGKPEEFYTCTLDNGASKKTSDRVYERDLFEDESDGGPWWIALIVIPVGFIAGGFGLYKFNEKFHKFVDERSPCGKESKSSDEESPNSVKDSEKREEVAPLKPDEQKKDDNPTADAPKNTMMENNSASEVVPSSET